MENFINTLTQNPLFLVIAIAVAVLILFGMVKKLFKMTLVIVAVIVLYIGYLVATGQEVSVKTITKGMQSIGEKVKEKVGDASEKVLDETVKKVLDK